jgi:hypothetical protein
MSTPSGATAHRQTSTAQASPQSQGNNDIEEPGVSIRQMRRRFSIPVSSTLINICPLTVKVLYTFDDQSRTNCLARWPHVLDIQTVVMDETASIGVVDLKTCVQAIVQCSPELVAQLGQDYTVYAYDYSEYDNPLVGQGMLSWALASASPTSETLVAQSRQMITGRVCKNIMGLFTSGVKETLEVKLRLVQVPTVMQSEYLNSIEKYRELSKVIPMDFDPTEWTNFLQSNPNIAQTVSRISTPTLQMTHQREGGSMEVMNQLLSPSMQQQASADPFDNQSNNEAAASISRTSTPAGRRKPSQTKTSRPSSRTSNKRPRGKPRANSISGNRMSSGNFSGSEDVGTDGDDGPPQTRKRAKISKADWNSKSSFGSTTESLRVTASTAASVRLFRPIASAADLNRGSHLQEVPRAPTPVPNLPQPNIPHQRTASMSGLRQQSFVNDTAPPRYKSPYLPDPPEMETQDRVRMSIESAMTSPEQHESGGETPDDIASSPPVMRTGSPMRSSPPVPSSPMLPRMPQTDRTDSGYLSGPIEELFDDEGARQGDDDDVPISTQYSKRRGPRVPKTRPEVHHGFDFEEVTPGPPEALPTKMLPRTNAKPPNVSAKRAASVASDDGLILPAPKPRRQLAPLPTSLLYESTPSQGPEKRDPSVSAAPCAPAPSSRPGSRSMVRTASSGSLSLPAVTASDPIVPRSGLHRSQTWSDAPQPPTDGINGPAPFTAATPTDTSDNSGLSRSTKSKKATIRVRLEAAVARGEMPPFCTNCGAIETPVWRKAWTQEMAGDPGYHEYSDEPGRVTAIDVLEKDPSGKPTKYRIIKKTLTPEEDKKAYVEILLCNREFFKATTWDLY